MAFFGLFTIASGFPKDVHGFGSYDESAGYGLQQVDYSDLGGGGGGGHGGFGGGYDQGGLENYQSFGHEQVLDYGHGSEQEQGHGHGHDYSYDYHVSFLSNHRPPLINNNNNNNNVFFNVKRLIRNIHSNTELKIITRVT